MTIDSTNLNSPRPDNFRTSTRQAEPASRPSQQAPAAPESVSTGDSVSLSSSAVTLTQVEATLRSAPDVDLARVDAVRARVESGEYNIDSNNLAQILLDTEN